MSVQNMSENSQKPVMPQAERLDASGSKIPRRLDASGNKIQHRLDASGNKVTRRFEA